MQINLSSELCNEFEISREEVQEQINNAWKTTLQDLLSLILTFFILIYSISDPSQGKWYEVSKTLLESFNQDKNFEIPFLNKVDSDYLYQVLKDKIIDEDELKTIHIELKDNKLILSLPINELFKIDEYELNLSAKARIYFLANSLFELENKIAVNAVTNILFIDSDQSKNDYILNFARANKVRQILQELSFVENIATSVVDKNHNTINPIGLDKQKFNDADRIDIIIYD